MATLEATSDAGGVSATAPVVTFTPVPQYTPEQTPFVVVPTPGVLLGEDAWQAQQSNRREFGEDRRFQTTAPVPLFWFDPVTGQQLEIGRLVGDFVATAQFALPAQNNAEALAVPYRINQDYGLTSISAAVVDRMAAAQYPERVEAFVLLGEEITPVATAAQLLWHAKIPPQSHAYVNRRHG